MTYFAYYFLLKLFFISYVVGVVNVEHRNRNERDLGEKTLDSVNNEVLKNTSAQLPCKELSLSSGDRFSPSYSIYSDAREHSTVQRDSTGHLKYFEMHISIKTDKAMKIRLMNKQWFLDTNFRYYICVGCENNQYTTLYKYGYGYAVLQHTHTPDVFSATEFRALYVKIDNGKLEIGKEGSDPFISYNDESFGLVNHFQFDYDANKEATVRYDCPAPTEL